MSIVAAYVTQAARHARAVFLLACVLLGVCAALAAKLPVFANVSYLLPEQTRSVQDLRQLEKRAKVLGTLMVAVTAEHPAERARIANKIAQSLAALGPDMVASLTSNHQEGAQFAWNNRFLLASEADLASALAALPGWLAQQTARRNPLAMDLEGAAVPATQESSSQSASKLLARLSKLERQARSSNELVSADGRLQLLIVQTPFAAGSTAKSAALLRAAKQVVAEACANVRGVEVGLAGDIVSSVEEERAILQGVITSTCVTLLLVGAGLWAYYRSLYATLTLSFALLCGTGLTFAITRFTIGHLNLATAFLTSIVLGNGINFGIILLARFVERLGAHRDSLTACIEAVASSWRGTLAAALAASAAYISLTVTQFRGFRDFGCIASGGMVLCWLMAYAILPPLLVVGANRGWLLPQATPPIGRLLARLVPRNALAGRLSVAASMALAGLLAAHYLAAKPFEQDFHNIRSDSPKLREEQAWMHRIDQAFGTGISGGFVLAVERREQALPLLQRLQRDNEGKPDEQAYFGRLRSLDDFLPGDVARKLPLLQKLRAQLLAVDSSALGARARHAVEVLTPPESLEPWGDEDVPLALAWPFVEADGSRGRLVLASMGPRIHSNLAPDLLNFTDHVRAMKLGDSVHIGGSAFVFADMVRLVAADGPRATLAAALAACATVVALLGASRHALATLLAGAFGVSAMLAACGWLGLKINFLDFVALPITIGIGIDYAVNLAARSRLEGRGHALAAVRGAGGAICLASYTTIIGYGSMLLSSNRGIRSFGHAAILGEFTCLLAGLVAAPVLLDWLWPAPMAPLQTTAAPTPQDKLPVPAPATPGRRGTAEQNSSPGPQRPQRPSAH